MAEKSEKEAALDRKIAEIRLKNAEINRRRAEVEEDIKNANESSRAAGLNEGNRPNLLHRQHLAQVHQRGAKKSPRGRNPYSIQPVISKKIELRSIGEKSNNKFPGVVPPQEPNFGFLSLDPSRNCEFADEKRNSSGQRGGFRGGRGRGGGKSRDGNFSQSPSQQGIQPMSKREMEMSMTGKERLEYSQWRAEREEIDRQRLSRSQNKTGQWRREWDVHKGEGQDPDDNPSSFSSSRDSWKSPLCDQRGRNLRGSLTSQRREFGEGSDPRTNEQRGFEDRRDHGANEGKEFESTGLLEERSTNSPRSKGKGGFELQDTEPNDRREIVFDDGKMQISVPNSLDAKMKAVLGGVKGNNTFPVPQPQRDKNQPNSSSQNEGSDVFAGNLSAQNVPDPGNLVITATESTRFVDAKSSRGDVNSKKKSGGEVESRNLKKENDLSKKECTDWPEEDEDQWETDEENDCDDVVQEPAEKAGTVIGGESRDSFADELRKRHESMDRIEREMIDKMNENIDLVEATLDRSEDDIDSLLSLKCDTTGIAKSHSSDRGSNQSRSEAEIDKSAREDISPEEESYGTPAPEEREDFQDARD